MKDGRKATMKLEDMIRGWFVGNFKPTALQTDACEVGVKHYRAGDYESTHYHRIATEITVVVSGRVRMLGSTYVSGDIVTVPPMTATDFEVLEDAITVVVKVPGASNDKYIGTPKNNWRPSRNELSEGYSF